MRIGAHESTAGGLANAFGRAAEHGAEAVQIFTRSSRQWAARPLSAAETREFAAARGAVPVLAHASYLVNAAAEPGEVRRRSRDALVTELERAEALGIRWVVVHPGCHEDEQRGLTNIAQSLDLALRATPRARAGFLLEGTAGQGSSLGHRFEHLGALLAVLRRPQRMGVCLDTCHLYAAGWDLETAAGCAAMLEEFDRVVGLDRLHAFHLNDSVKGRGSRVDRHARIGEGRLGTQGFAFLVNDPRLADLPGVLETPPGRWPEELALLRSLRRPPAARRTRASVRAAPSPRAAARRAAVPEPGRRPNTLKLLAEPTTSAHLPAERSATAASGRPRSKEPSRGPRGGS